MQTRQHHGLKSKFLDVIGQSPERQLPGKIEDLIKAAGINPEGDIDISCQSRLAIKQDSLPARYVGLRDSGGGCSFGVDPDGARGRIGDRALPDGMRRRLWIRG